jgi:hypothetical protein
VFAIVRLVFLLIAVAAAAWALGRGGFGWGGGRGNGSGAGDGGASGTPATEVTSANPWTVRVSGDGYQLNGKPIALPELRSQLEAAKQGIQDKKEAVRIVVTADARVNAKRELKEMVEALGLPAAEETR